MNNKYKKRSRISNKKFRKIVKCFSLDIEASKIAVLTRISRNSINKIVKYIRMKIAEHSEKESLAVNEGRVIDENYFDNRKSKPKRKSIVFNIIKRGEKIYTQMAKNCSTNEPTAISKSNYSSVIYYTGSFRTCDGLVSFGYRRPYKYKYRDNKLATDKNNHIDGIENFWDVAKTRLKKFRGIHKSTFYLHLKECEFRFNYRNEDTYKLLLQLLRKYHP